MADKTTTTRRHPARRPRLARDPPPAPRRPGPRRPLRRRRASPSPSRVDARELRHALHGGRRRARASTIDGDVDAGRAQGRPAPPGARRDRCTSTCCASTSTSRSRRRSRSTSSASTTRPASREGGVLEQSTREVNVEALPDRHPRVPRARRLRDGDQRHASRSRRSPRPGGVTLARRLSRPSSPRCSPRASQSRPTSRRARDGDRASSARASPEPPRREGDADGGDDAGDE